MVLSAIRGSKASVPKGKREDRAMYNVTLGDALPMIGSFGIDLDYTVRLKLRLRDKIDCGILKEAVDPKPFPRPGIIHHSLFIKKGAILAVVPFCFMET